LFWIFLNILRVNFPSACGELICHFEQLAPPLLAGDSRNKNASHIDSPSAGSGQAITIDVFFFVTK